MEMTIESMEEGIARSSSLVTCFTDDEVAEAIRVSADVMKSGGFDHDMVTLISALSILGAASVLKARMMVGGEKKLN